MKLELESFYTHPLKQGLLPVELLNLEPSDLPASLIPTALQHSSSLPPTFSHPRLWKR